MFDVEQRQQIISYLCDQEKFRREQEKREMDVLLWRLREAAGGKDIVIKADGKLTNSDIIIRLS